MRGPGRILDDVMLVPLGIGSVLHLPSLKNQTLTGQPLHMAPPAESTTFSISFLELLYGLEPGERLLVKTIKLTRVTTLQDLRRKQKEGIEAQLPVPGCIPFC